MTGSVRPVSLADTQAWPRFPGCGRQNSKATRDRCSFMSGQDHPNPLPLSVGGTRDLLAANRCSRGDGMKEGVSNSVLEQANSHGVSCLGSGHWQGTAAAASPESSPQPAASWQKYRDLKFTITRR